MSGKDLVVEARALLSKATPGRWFWTVNFKAKQISLQSQGGPRQYVMDFVRYGMNGAQPRFNVEGLMQDAQNCAVVVEGREHHAAWYQTVDHPDANLIARAPELLSSLCDEVERLRNLARKFAFEEGDDAGGQVDALRAFHGKDSR